jgi:hypothetical protein
MHSGLLTGVTTRERIANFAADDASLFRIVVLGGYFIVTSPRSSADVRLNVGYAMNIRATN